MGLLLGNFLRRAVLENTSVTSAELVADAGERAATVRRFRPSALAELDVGVSSSSPVVEKCSTALTRSSARAAFSTMGR